MVGLSLPLLNRKSCPFTTNAYSRNLKMKRPPCSGSPLFQLAGRGSSSPVQAASSHAGTVMALTAGQHLTLTSPPEAEAALGSDEPGLVLCRAAIDLNTVCSVALKSTGPMGLFPLQRIGFSPALGGRPQHPHQSLLRDCTGLPLNPSG